MRIYPHLQDTGGFFVAVLERKQGGEAAEHMYVVVLLTRPLHMLCRADDGLCRERKREAGEPVDVDVPEAKKPRLVVGNELGEAQVERGDAGMDDAGEPHEAAAESVDDVVMDGNPPAAKPSQVGSNKGKRKAKPSESGGSFKENPYTFLSPDDPNLQSCMYVVLLLVVPPDTPPTENA